MSDQPDPSNPGVSIAYAIGALVDTVERCAIALEAIHNVLDEGMADLTIPYPVQVTVERPVDVRVWEQ